MIVILIVKFDIKITSFVFLEPGSKAGKVVRSLVEISIIKIVLFLE